MKATEIKIELIKFIRQNGLQNLAKLVGNSIDECSIKNNYSCGKARETFSKKFNAFTELNLHNRK